MGTIEYTILHRVVDGRFERYSAVFVRRMFSPIAEKMSDAIMRMARAVVEIVMEMDDGGERVVIAVEFDPWGFFRFRKIILRVRDGCAFLESSRVCEMIRRIAEEGKSYGIPILQLF